MLCRSPESSQGRPTTTMFRNCGSHFAATMSILQPTLVISQGRAVAQWVEQLYLPDHRYGPHLHEAHADYGKVIVCAFSHPSARGSERWGDRLDAPYLAEVVAPALIQAKSLL